VTDKGAAPDASISHVGICVSDLERSLAFYRDGLGFEEYGAHQVGAEFGSLLEVDGVALQSRFLRNAGVSIELLHFDQPGHTGDGERRSMNELGLTHLSFRVTDCDAVAARLSALGGRVLDHTRTKLEPAAGVLLEFVYCTDPDGVRIELMALPATAP
jgi:glyoxylase I family protein